MDELKICFLSSRKGLPVVKPGRLLVKVVGSTLDPGTQNMVVGEASGSL